MYLLLTREMEYTKAIKHLLTVFEFLNKIRNNEGLSLSGINNTPVKRDLVVNKYS